jgi:hypothetical protein
MTGAELMRKTVTHAFAALLAVPIAAAALTMAPVPAGASGPYSVIDWGTLPSSPVPATYAADFGSINANGDGVGQSYLGNGIWHAVLFKNGTLTDLGGLPPADSSAAFGVNISDTVVGQAGTDNEATHPGHPAEWSSSGHLEILNTDHYGNAFSINDSGNAVGDFTDGNGVAQSAVEWLNNSANTVNLPGPANSPAGAAAAINNNGTIVGVALTTGGHFEAVTFSAGAPAQPLPTPAGSIDTEGVALSQNGIIVGQATLPSQNTEAVQFGPGPVAVVLPALPGDASCGANGVNSSDVAVGSCSPANSPTATAVIWQNGAVTDLNSLIPANSGWVLEEATGINDNGQITGWGNDNGKRRAFTLTPALVIGQSPIPNLGLLVGSLLSGVGGLVANIVTSLGNGLHFTVK